MKPADLRMGNHVLIFLDVEIIDAIQENYCSTKGTMYLLGYECIEPIHITEDWLLKFGFYESKIKGEYGKRFIVDNDDKYEFYIFPLNDLWVIQLYNFYEEYGSVDHDVVSIPRNIQYIHELQNLYFWLAGRELELVNPEKKY